MVGFYRNAIETARAESSCPTRIGLGVRCTAASIGSAQTSQDEAPAFSPYRSAVLGVYVVVVAGLARRVGK
jgi:hypothetical protein